MTLEAIGILRDIATTLSNIQYLLIAIVGILFGRLIGGR
jgi:hypothetical protein